MKKQLRDVHHQSNVIAFHENATKILSCLLLQRNLHGIVENQIHVLIEALHVRSAKKGQITQ